jgi:hypothetical protein
LNYSVVESSGHVDVTITKKTLIQDVTFGIRTVEGSATEGKAFDPIEEVVTIKKR